MRTGLVPRVVLCLGLMAGASRATASAAGPGDPPRSPLAEGKEGMVVGLTGRRAVHAGLEVLKQGGGAVDAAMATATAQVVEAAGSYVSFAGILSMVYYDAASRTYHYLNAGYNTPIEEDDPLSIPRMDPLTGVGSPSGRTALVPGFMAGVQAAHDRFGRLSMARVLEPSIALAEDGFEVDASLAGYIHSRRAVVGRLPETRRIFTRPDGAFYGRGDRFRQVELAATLRRAAGGGAGVLYTGDWARRFVEAVRREGGRITARDLEAYRATWEAPIETTHRGARIVAPGFSSLGGVDTVEALNLLELAGLDARGLPSRSPESLFWLMQIAQNDNLTFEPGPATRRDPGRDLSLQARVTKEHARWLWGRIQAGEWPYTARPAARAGGPPGHSSGVVAADRWGNVAAVTHTINTALWGNTGLFVRGVSIPDSASFQQEAIQRAGPGRRLPEPMAPLIVARDGRPVLASTAIGGGLHQRNIQVLAGVLDFGLDAQAAVDAPAFLGADWTGSRCIARVPAGAFAVEVLDGVRSLGQEVKELGPAERGMFVGYWAGLAIEPRTGRLHGAGTAELPSHAEGY